MIETVSLAEGADVETKIGRGEELLTVPEVAEVLGRAERTVYYYVEGENPRLRALKTGKDLRIFREDAERLAGELAAGYEGQDEEAPPGSLDVQEMAEWLKQHPETVRRLYRRGNLRGHRAGANGKLYFLKDEVIEDLGRRRSKKQREDHNV